ncbi:cytochrome c oxidase assembly protein [Sporosarcina sp. P37]|uniref:SCO family protein n=1 Tax=unclassified Sporosarcina TaxID=2647733 RepID=UPI000A17C9AE|nr:MULTISPECIES: SCO family protein [unclassified Sporosarcina]ARK24053.1 cytochrome c oxidase assembly protein [Sporosarcina sp. P37]PID18556.1 cytochrome c oxidase assembly protein [Sporosarcina sp. P35]
MKLRAALFLCAVTLMLSACNHTIETNMSEMMPDFKFVTQDDEPLGLEDLKGDWWIAYFSYTNCETICPRTTANMVSIQEELKEEGLTPQIISFGIDPERDTQDVLKNYAMDYGADLSTMSFLTGYDFETVRDLSMNTFHSILEKGALDQRAHSYFFYLVSPKGEVVKKYDGITKSQNELLVEDVKTVSGK